MPEAIATTKRKFYKALDALTHPSRPRTAESLASKQTPSEPAVRGAAEAFDEARERVRKRLRLSASSSNGSLEHVNLSPVVHKLPADKHDTTKRPPPNFAPGSQESFLARLKTFSNVSTWHPKPDAINEVEWAKRGWRCVSINTVACKGGCEKRVVISLDTVKSSLVRPELEDLDANVDETNQTEEEADENAEHIEAALASQYKDLIVLGHAESCLWRKAGCKDDIYRLPVVRPAVWQSELADRFRSLLAVQSSLVHLELRGTDSTNSDYIPAKHILDELLSSIFGSYDAEAGTAETALEIALHGWQGSADSGMHLLQCNACFQRLGLWMYQPDHHVAQQDADTEGNNDDSDNNKAGSPSIDLLSTHRDYCPWQNGSSQKASGSLEGLNSSQILRKMIYNFIREERRRIQQRQLEANTNLVGDANGSDGEERIVPREEVARQDQERETRLKRIKTLLNFTRRSTAR